MANLSAPSADVFTAQERDLIRRQLGLHFSSYPAVADGILLRTWRGGAQAGQPKLPLAVQTMIARGLIEVRIGQRMHRAFFTEAGLVALRQLARDHRYRNPVRYGHVRRAWSGNTGGPYSGPVGHAIGRCGP